MLIMEPQGDLGRRLEVDVCLHGQLEHELAVLALADLEERPIVRGTDVIALGVDQQDVRGVRP